MRFRLRRIAPERIFGTRHGDDGIVIIMEVSYPTRTVVYLLDKPALGGGIRHMVEVVGEYFHSEHQDEDRLGDYLIRFGNGAGYKRLGYLLEELDVTAPVTAW